MWYFGLCMTIIVSKVERNLGKVTVLIIYALIAFYFVINGETLFNTWETNWTLNSIVYILGVTLFISVLDEIPKELKGGLFDNLKFFSISSILTLIVLLILRDFGLLFSNTSQLPYHLILSNMMFQLVIVATSEEIIFRGAIFGYLYDRFKLRSEKKHGWMIPYLLSSLIFALFHLAVYGLDLPTMIMIFSMGLLLCYAVDRWGIGASIGVHWIWNCMAIGIFTL